MGAVPDKGVWGWTSVVLLFGYIKLALALLCTNLILCPKWPVPLLTRWQLYILMAYDLFPLIKYWITNQEYILTIGNRDWTQ